MAHRASVVIRRHLSCRSNSLRMLARTSAAEGLWGGGMKPAIGPAASAHAFAISLLRSLPWRTISMRVL